MPGHPPRASVPALTTRAQMVKLRFKGSHTPTLPQRVQGTQLESELGSLGL